jgi:hypothetical protein
VVIPTTHQNYQYPLLSHQFNQQQQSTVFFFQNVCRCAFKDFFYSPFLGVEMFGNARYFVNKEPSRRIGIVRILSLFSRTPCVRFIFHVYHPAGLCFFNLMQRLCCVSFFISCPGLSLACCSNNIGVKNKNNFTLEMRIRRSFVSHLRRRSETVCRKKENFSRRIAVIAALGNHVLLAEYSVYSA